MNVYSYQRWSTTKQNDGDSERRQTAAALQWCQRKGVTLSERRFTDRGLSGKDGANRSKGQLAALLQITQPGDVILIEDNDRFSREDPITALNQLREKVLNRGVRVIFLKTGVEVTRENFCDPSVLFPNFFEGFLANAENSKRINRIRESWIARKDQIASGKPARHNYVCWLKWEGDDKTGKIVLDPEPAATVQRIFKMALNGFGPSVIVRKLTEEGVKPITKRANGWSTEYIHKVLTDKTAIGYCCHVEPPKAGIYPAVVSPEVFHAVQSMMKRRSVNKAPASSEGVNLFTGLTKCAKCGFPVSLHRQEIASGKRYHYLVCAGGRRGPAKCGMTGIRYDLFEPAMLEILSALDKLRLKMQENDGPSPIEVMETRLKELERKGEKLWKLIDGDDSPSKRVYDDLKATEKEENELREAVLAAKAQVKMNAVELSWGQLRQILPQKLSDADYRLRLKAAVREIVDSVSVNLKAKTFDVKIKGYAEPITAELEGENLHYVVTTGKDKSLGCCCPLSARWKVSAK